ncbi:MAG: hypothetical protein WAW39_04630 [Prosthecobacter sp.]|uniref:hypothetical protein n=1 Tax=Prosthecobacter sp. TaxID=1965333 RepID=UPI003BAF7782
MRILLTLVAFFACSALGQAQEMFNQYEILARQYAASTGQPYELCLKALQIAAWCKANPQGGTVNGQVYDAQATAAQLAEAKRILTSQQAPQPAAPTLPPIGSGGLSTRPAVPVGRSANDPQRMAEQLARQQRQNAGQNVGRGGGGNALSFRFLIKGDFAGFSGTHTFTMENGQVWRQVDNVVTRHNPVIHNPTGIITIYNNNNGGTTGILEVVGVPGSVQVQLQQPIILVR